LDTHEALLSRRTIHEFQEGPVDEAAITRALTAALRAPNHKLTNPWRFTRVGPETRPHLIDLGVRLKTESKRLSEEQQRTVRKKWSSPHALIVVSVTLADDPLRRREDFAATSCAIQNLSLSLWADGIGSKWSTTGLIRDPRGYELLQIDPDLEEILGLLWIGIPGTVPDPPRDPLEEVLRNLP
jgi:nitroreductase